MYTSVGPIHKYGSNQSNLSTMGRSTFILVREIVLGVTSPTLITTQPNLMFRLRPPSGFIVNDSKVNF